MKRIAAAITTCLMLVGGLAQASPAAAATTWDFANAPFTLSDGSRSSVTVTVQNMRVTGSSAVGYVIINDAANPGRYSCTSKDFSLLTVNWLVGALAPCSGSITFSVDQRGLLRINDSAIVIEGRLFTGAGQGSVQGIAQKPVVVPLIGCKASSDVTAQEIDFGWSDNPDATSYEVAVSGVSGPSITVGPGGSAGADFAALAPGTSYSATVNAMRADGETVATCVTNGAWTPPAAPVINSTVPVVPGGLLTVNYSLTDPTGVQGIEYSLDSGPWLRPGGVAPVNGAGGSFTLSGLAAKDLTLKLRTVGDDAGGPLTTQSASTSVSFAKAPAARPTTPGSVIGATSAAPVAAPPALPVSNVAGTSNGAGTGTNGALAANTGDAGIDAPCLAADGTLYPNQYSTVGSQLTMAPNTSGMGKVTSFTVVGGTLAPGMQLDRTYGVLFGTTTQAGSYVTTVKARFANGSTKTSEFTTRVDADPQTLQYAARNIGVVGKATAIAPTTNAPETGTTYALVCGEVPAGTRFDSATGLITGRPTRPVLLPTPLRVAETSPTGRAAASFIYVVTRTGASSFSYPAHPHLRAGKRAVIRPTITGPRDFVIFRTSKGKLPKGLRLNSKTGVITGKVRHASRPHTITIVAVTTGGALITAAPMKISMRR